MNNQNNTLLEYSIEDEEENKVGNLDLISIVIVCVVIFSCLAVCFLIGSQKRNKHKRRNQQGVIGDDLDIEQPFPIPTSMDPFTTSPTPTEGVVDRGILRGNASTPESPPPSYYGQAREQSFQSFSSNTSSQYEVPPAYNEAFRTRSSLVSHSIPEDGVFCEGVSDVSRGEGSVVVGNEVDRGSGTGGSVRKKNRKSLPGSSKSFGKEKKKLRSKSDLIKEKRNRHFIPTTSAHNSSRNTNNTEEETEEAINNGHFLLKNASTEEGEDRGVMRQEVKRGISMPTRFNRKNSKTDRFTPV